MSKENNGRLPAAPSASAAASGEEYKVGPGRPPREYQFKPGQSGNPKGAKRKPPSLALDLKLLLEQALNKTVTLKQGEKERIVTLAAAGIEQMVAQFAKGDHRARRDLIAIADKLGVDLISGRTNAIDDLLSTHQEIIDAYVNRQYDTVVRRPPVLAPPELLDDDSEGQGRK